VQFVAAEPQPNVFPLFSQRSCAELTPLSSVIVAVKVSVELAVAVAPS
jgi:hypothetical protein